MPSPAFQRARSDEHKQQRAAAFVEAARAVAAEEGVTAVTLTAIAKRVGVHHSALRRYFGSHQELLLHVAGDGWQQWSVRARAALAAGPEPATPERVAAALARSLAADPLFCDLLVNVPLHLEHEVELDAVLAFKEVSHRAIVELADALETALPALSHDDALDLITTADALAATLWQVAHPSQALARAMTERPDNAPTWALDFEPTLTRLLTATCAGLAGDGRRARGPSAAR